MTPKSVMLSCALTLVFQSAALAAPIDLSGARIVVLNSESKRLANAADMLRDEIEKRTRLSLDVVSRLPADADREPTVLIGTAKQLAAEGYQPPSEHAVPSKVDGYSLWMDREMRGVPTICAAGHDERGALFAAGRLLRLLDMERDGVKIDSALGIATAPKYRLRGHQFAYRPKTNAYDGWDIDLWEQYCRDMIVFGSNLIELIPPSSDDVDDSPHFPKPKLEMMVAMSQLADDYGLEVWVWSPLPRRLRHAKIDYADTQAVDAALVDWEEYFRALPRIDNIFVPGGDPGNVHPSILLPLLRRQKKILNRYHPRAGLWVSPQNFDRVGKSRDGWYRTFIDILKNDSPDWLDGVVFGPAVPVSLVELRRDVPAKYPIRRYPDITHASSCPYQTQGWDEVWKKTLGREPINPRPVAHRQIFKATAVEAIGFASYSEGCHDDVNKIVWSSLGWDPEMKIDAIVGEYSKYFISQEHADGLARGIFALEENWVGPVKDNESVYRTLELFRDLEKKATPGMKLNWRFQQLLYRAYYDAYTRHRLLYELDLESQAMDLLEKARELGALRAIDRAAAILEEAETRRVASDLRTRAFALGEALFQSIRMQQSVEKYLSQRYANLDDIDTPLNDRENLEKAFAEIRGLESDEKRLERIRSIIRDHAARRKASDARTAPANWPDWTVEFDNYQRKRSALFRPFNETVRHLPK